MASERWRAATEIFNAALERSPNERSGFVAGASGGDENLRRHVERLLKYHEKANDFIASPAFEAAPDLFSEDPEELIGQHLGPYRVISILGIGGMGVVYLACDERLGRKVGLKLVPPSLVANAAQLARVEREARTASALNHPNIVTVHEIGEADGSHYIATEYIEGITLRQRIAKGPLPPNEAIEIATQLVGALCAAHEAGIVHRDVKPENIMLRRDGYVKVLDFGIAKFIAPSVTAAGVNATLPGMILGTTRYLSPEQARGQQTDAQSDIWSVGVVLYEMLTGAAPFDGETPTDVMAAVLMKEPPALGKEAGKLPAELHRVIARGLQKEKSKRYETSAELLNDLRRLKSGGTLPAATGGKQRKQLLALAATAAAAGVLFLVWQPFRRSASSYAIAQQPAIRDKSIAVLPFQNLNADEENAFFADAVQDQILTDLSKVADLKVISRTSVMQFKKATNRNVREIAQQLGVAHVVEGSVQRAANRVRVSAQLIEARSDTHLWAQTYDRDVADVFAIQSEIARAIADQLQAKLSPREKDELDRPPTTDLVAFDLYTHAKNVIESAFVDTTRSNLLKAVDLLNEAIARDRQFFLAYCALADAHDGIYFLAIDRSPARVALADAALETAFRLRPDAGDAHYARAQHLYRCKADYEGALAELAIARRSLPNDSRVVELTGYIQRRRGQHEEGVRSLERALDLDPRNHSLFVQIGNSYAHMRRYAERAATLERGLRVFPGDSLLRAERASVELTSHADFQTLDRELTSLLVEHPGAASTLAAYMLECAFAKRDPAAVERALAALDNESFGNGVVFFSRSYGEGLIARMTGDENKARDAFTAARAEQEKTVEAQPDSGGALCVLGLIDAALGRKEEALREGRRAMELIPIAKDSLNGTLLFEFFAVICAWAGEKDLALQQLAAANRLPAAFLVNYGSLKLDPLWDPLRDDPRFDALTAELAPKLRP